MAHTQAVIGDPGRIAPYSSRGRGSIPILSFTADEIRWVQPRYRSVVWTETWPRRN